MASNERVSAVLLGGIILGVWVYGLLFEFPQWDEFNYGRWAVWGLLGLLVAGGIYGARAATDTARLVIISLIGVLITVIVLGATLNGNPYVFATLATLVGGAFITAALPTPAGAIDKEAEPPGRE